MKRKLTEHAITAIEAIRRANHVGSNVSWSIESGKRRFDFEVQPNEKYNQELIQFVGSACLVKMVDVYQWYNSKILNLLASHDPKAFQKFTDNVNLSSSDIRKLSDGIDPMTVIAHKISFKDSSVRKHLHKILDFWEESEMSILVTIRNCFAHHLGLDKDGEVAEWIKKGKSSWNLKENISIVDGKIVLGFHLPSNLSEIGLAQISIFDQQVANRYGLRTQEPDFAPLSKYTKPLTIRSV